MVVIALQGAKRSAREELAIKGPGIRLDLDVRRVWRCPTCQRVLKTAGHITSRRCPIDGAFMQLDDSAQRAARRFSFPPITIDEDQAHPDQTVSTQPAHDDDDRPRKQSRKQKRRQQRRKPDTAEDTAEDTELDSSADVDTSATETEEPAEAEAETESETEAEAGTETGTDTATADDPKSDTAADAEAASRGSADQ
jgi:hypothetical protein